LAQQSPRRPPASTRHKIQAEDGPGHTAELLAQHVICPPGEPGP
jgi:hypothetical protein